MGYRVRDYLFASWFLPFSKFFTARVHYFYKQTNPWEVFLNEKININPCFKIHMNCPIGGKSSMNHLFSRKGVRIIWKKKRARKTKIWEAKYCIQKQLDEVWDAKLRWFNKWMQKQTKCLKRGGTIILNDKKASTAGNFKAFQK